MSWSTATAPRASRFTSAGAVNTATVAGSRRLPHHPEPGDRLGPGQLRDHLPRRRRFRPGGSARRRSTSPPPTRPRRTAKTFTFTGSEFTTGAGELVNGDSVTSVTLTSAGAVNTATVAGSPYLITPSLATGSGLANYAITYHNGAGRPDGQPRRPRPSRLRAITTRPSSASPSPSPRRSPASAGDPRVARSTSSSTAAARSPSRWRRPGPVQHLDPPGRQPHGPRRLQRRRQPDRLVRRSVRRSDVNKATTTVSITNAASISSTDTVVGESYEVFVTVTADSPSRRRRPARSASRTARARPAS